MIKSLKYIMLSALVTACAGNTSVPADEFQYNDERFADLQMLRYKVEGFDSLTLNQKTLIYHLSEAALYGRDILFDQNGKYNLRIMRTLETVYTDFAGDKQSEDFKALEVYLKRVWFSAGIHHHYGSEKFVPGFTEEFFRDAVKSVDASKLPLLEGQTVDELLAVICPVMFDPAVMPKRVNLAEGEDLILTSACNYYDGVTQAEAEEFYAKMKDPQNEQPVMYGMNSRLVKDANGVVKELRWTTDGLYGEALTKIVACLERAIPYAEDDQQKAVIEKLIEYYKSGDLKTFDDYTILWVNNTEPLIDFVNGFTESYGDPLGLKASWESIVNFKDVEATKRTVTMSDNAQWFEDNSPVDDQFKKEEVKGVTAKVINAAILGGDLYPSTAIGINLPNSDWVRKEHGSKSVTIANLTSAYSKAAAGNGFMEEFTYSQTEIDLMKKYGDITDDLHTDLHECLGHGSGKLLPGVESDSLKAYGSTIEEARADLFGLYYMGDDKMLELGLLPDGEAYKAQYYSYIQNGLLTQIVRINLGNDIEEAHMRNRAIIARWAYEHGKADNVIEMVERDGKTFVKVNDYVKLRELFGKLLAEVQRIKSTGDLAAAQALVENYGVKIDPALHKEILDRYARLDLAPYKGFINPVYTAVKDENGNIIDVKIDYTEGYADQMLRYSSDYRTLPHVN